MPDNPYNNTRWRKERDRHLKEHPFCVYCEQLGRLKIAEVVDHKIPHKGDEELMWSRDNFQSLCFDCHNSAKAIKESKGTIPGCGLDGTPLDPEHHWNR